MGHGGGQVISVLAFDSDDPSSKLAEVNSFFVKFMFNRTKINKKRRPELAYFKDTNEK